MFIVVVIGLYSQCWWSLNVALFEVEPIAANCEEQQPWCDFSIYEQRSATEKDML